MDKNEDYEKGFQDGFNTYRKLVLENQLEKDEKEYKRLKPAIEFMKEDIQNIKFSKK